MDGAEILIPLTMFAGGFAMIFGIVYLKTRQNMAMIEKGMNPKEFVNRPAPYKNLKWALGLFLAYMLDTFVLKHSVTTEIFNGYTYHHRDNDNPAVYFALIAIGGGLGLFGSYRIEKKWWDDNKGRD